MFLIESLSRTFCVRSRRRSYCKYKTNAVYGVRSKVSLADRNHFLPLLSIEICHGLATLHGITFYVLCHFMARVIIALHNILPFVVVSRVWSYAEPPIELSVCHSHKIAR